MCTRVCASHPLCEIPVLICYTGRTYSDKCCVLDYYSWQEPGILMDICMLLASGLGAFIVLFLVEFKVFTNLIFDFETISEKTIPPEEPAKLDQEVLHEKLIVRRMDKESIKNYGLVAKDLCKFYRDNFAVKRLCLTVQECVSGS